MFLASNVYNQVSCISYIQAGEIFMNENKPDPSEELKSAAHDTGVMPSTPEGEISEKDLDSVAGGLKKLPGIRKPPTLTLKRG